MRWPWSKTQPVDLETHASGYTDEVVNLILARVTGTPLSQPNATGALEACAGLVGRSFAVAEVEGPDWARAALTPACLGMVGRALIRQGEILFAIDADREGTIKLFPSADHDVQGGYDPASWLYRLNLQGPSEVYTREQVTSQSVLHFIYAQHPQESWRGIGPLQAASLAGRLSAETSKALGDELAGPRGALLPLPNTDGADESIVALKSDIKTLGGSVAFVENMSTNWDSGDRRTAPSNQWESVRLGARPPDSVINLQDLASREIMAACGISPGLFSSTAAASARESYRQMLFTVLSPLGKMVSAELTQKLEAQITLTWSELRAADVMSRARAYGSLVGANMDANRAAELTGLDS